MEKPVSPHDRYFRSAMADLRVAKDFFQHYLPQKIKNKVDLSSLKLCKGSHVDQQLKLSVTDILYKVNIQQQPAYIYLLVEHQSTADLLMPFRILKYMLAIMDQHLKQSKEKILPLIVPMVFYHGHVPYPHSTDIFDLFAENRALATDILFKPFQLIDIGQIPDKDIRQHQWSGIMEFVVKHIFERDILPYLKQIVQSLKAIEESDGHDYIITTLKYIYIAGGIHNERDFAQIIEEELSTNIGAEVMTLAELHMQKGIERGREQGMEKGMQAGLKKGKEEVAYNLLSRGYNVADIAEITGLSIHEITQLKITAEEELN